MIDDAPSLEHDQFLRDLPIIDAHHHFWDLSGPIAYPWLQTPPWLSFRYGDYGAIRQNYMPEHFYRDHQRHNIIASVHMEAEPRDGMATDEIKWLSSLGPKAPKAAAAQIWLNRDNIAEQLGALTQLPLVRSVRHKPTAQTRENARRDGAGSMDDPVWRDGYALLADTPLHFELQTPWWHLDAACALARDFPQTSIILNHCGLPSDRSDEGLKAWHRAVARFAQCENTIVKVSGIGLAPGWWPEEQNRWILRELIAMFGPSRAMFASNFPVDSICIGYDRLFTNFKRSVCDMPRNQIGDLFSGTASRVYDISL